jgi:PASTA domain
VADHARTPDEEPTQAVPGAPGESADETAPVERAPDETAPMERAPDQTAPMERAIDETAPVERVPGAAAAGQAASDETAPMEPVGDETAPMEPVPGQAAARWAGRAGVPSPSAQRARTEQEWQAADEEPAGAWWMPILVGIAALALVGLILLGIWLALHAQKNPPVSPTPTATASARPSPSPSPTPSPSPSPSAATVLLPPLRGLTVSDAEQALTSMGLRYTTQTRVDGTLPPGTVSGTQPDANTQVPVGSRVILFVAAAPPTSAPPQSPPAS